MKKNKPQKKDSGTKSSFKNRYLYNKFFKGSVICSDFLKNHNFEVVHLETSKSRINAILPKELAKNIDLNKTLYFQIEVIDSSKIQIVHAEQTVNAPCTIVAKIKLEDEISDDEIIEDFAEMGFSSNFYKNFSKELEELTKKEKSKNLDVKVIDELAQEYAQNKLKIIEKNKDFYERNDNLVFDYNHVEIFLDYICDYYDNLTYEFEEKNSEYEHIYDLIQVIDNGLKLKHIFRIFVDENLCAKLLDLNTNETMYFNIELFNIFELIHKRIKTYYHIKEKDKDYADFFKEFFRECFIETTNITDDATTLLDKFSIGLEKIFADQKFLSKLEKTKYLTNYKLISEDCSKYTQNKKIEIPKMNQKLLSDSSFILKLRRAEILFVTVNRCLQAFEYSLLKYATFGTLDTDQVVGDDSWFSNRGINYYLNEFSSKMLHDPMVSKTTKDIFSSSKQTLKEIRNYLHHKFPIYFAHLFYFENLSESQLLLDKFIKKLSSYQKYILFSFKNLFPDTDIQEINIPKGKLGNIEELPAYVEHNTLFCNYYFELLFTLLKIENRLYNLLFTFNKKQDQEHSYSENRIEYMQNDSLGEYINYLERLPKAKNNNFLFISTFESNIDLEKLISSTRNLKNIRNFWVHKALLTFDLFTNNNKKQVTNKINEIKLALNKAESVLKDIEKIIAHS